MPAKEAPAFKSIPFSSLARASSRFSLRFSSASWNGFISAPDVSGPSAILTRLDSDPGSHPGPLATSAYVVPGPADS